MAVGLLYLVNAVLEIAAGRPQRVHGDLLLGVADAVGRIRARELDHQQRDRAFLVQRAVIRALGHVNQFALRQVEILAEVHRTGHHITELIEVMVVPGRIKSVADLVISETKVDLGDSDIDRILNHF